jgi:hypothetical protein
MGNAMSAERRMRFRELREHAWEKGFAALTKFKARKNHCLVPRDYVERDYKLGQWVSVQRYSRATISAERRRRLDAIGFVWDWREYAWEEGFAVLTKFKAREGHCRVPSLHIEGRFKLGHWVAAQRRKKDTISSERRKQLEKIEFMWNAFKSRWEEAFSALATFKAREGHCRLPLEHIEGTFRLGRWVSVQRSNKDTMLAERKKRLDEIGFVWRVVQRKKYGSRLNHQSPTTPNKLPLQFSAIG